MPAPSNWRRRDSSSSSTLAIVLLQMATPRTLTTFPRTKRQQHILTSDNDLHYRTGVWVLGRPLARRRSGQGLWGWHSKSTGVRRTPWILPVPFAGLCWEHSTGKRVYTIADWLTLNVVASVRATGRLPLPLTWEDIAPVAPLVGTVTLCADGLLVIHSLLVACDKSHGTVPSTRTASNHRSAAKNTTRTIKPIPIHTSMETAGLTRKNCSRYRATRWSEAFNSTENQQRSW